MTTYSAIIKELDASRKLGSEIALEKHQQDLQRSKIQLELENLQRSRKQYIESEINKSQTEYQKNLQENKEITELHKKRELRNAQEKAKIAQLDFQRERKRLIEEKNEYDRLDNEQRLVEMAMLNLQAKSKVAHEDEDRKLFERQTQKKAIIKMLEESRQRESYHYERAKKLAL